MSFGFVVNVVAECKVIIPSTKTLEAEGMIGRDKVSLNLDGSCVPGCFWRKLIVKNCRILVSTPADEASADVGVKNPGWIIFSLGFDASTDFALEANKEEFFLETKLLSAISVRSE